MIQASGPSGSASPRWSATTKLVVALSMVAVVAALVIRFRFIITPLLVSLVFAYLLYPVASFLQLRLGFSWGASVLVVYLVVVALLLAGLTAGGLGLVGQVESVVAVLRDALAALPDLVSQLSGQVFQFGPFRLDLRSVDLPSLSRQLLGAVEPVLSQTGAILGSVAGSAGRFIGWTFFVILVSYFILAESGGLRGRILSLEVPGYGQDIARLGRELGRIWNAFLRGQTILFVAAFIVYSVLLTLLGVRYSIGLAFLAGLARFVPYVGPAITWTALGLVAFFQDYKLFNLSPLQYASLVLVLALVIDWLFDNIASPRIMSQALRVHPAAVLVTAVVAANLLGILGVVIAAPMLATATLLWEYTLRKLLELDPFPEPESESRPPPAGRALVLIRRLWRNVRRTPQQT